jgi:hypothetical protein
MNFLFEFFSIHINYLLQLPMNNMALKQHHINICNKANNFSIHATLFLVSLIVITSYRQWFCRLSKMNHHPWVHHLGIICLHLNNAFLRCKHNKLYVLIIFSSLNENKYKITIKPIKTYCTLIVTFKSFQLAFFHYFFEMQIGFKSIFCNNGVM